jgi:hypothetical protein
MRYVFEHTSHSQFVHYPRITLSFNKNKLTSKRGRFDYAIGPEVLIKVIADSKTFYEPLLESTWISIAKKK